MSLLTSAPVSFRFMQMFRDLLLRMNALLGVLVLVLILLASEVVRLEFTEGFGSDSGRVEQPAGIQLTLVMSRRVRAEERGGSDACCGGSIVCDGCFGDLDGGSNSLVVHRSCDGAMEHGEHGKVAFERAAVSSRAQDAREERRG